MTARRALAVLLTIVAMTVASAAPSASAAGGATRHCAMVVFTPNSGDGLFDITARWISCRTARSLLRATGGAPERLRRRGWRCRLAVRYPSGSGRYACTSRARVGATLRTRRIAYTTGS